MRTLLLRSECRLRARPHGEPLFGRLQVIAATLVQILVRIAHGLRAAAAEHHVEIDRPEAVVLVAVDHAGRARDAFPRPEPRGDALPALVLDEHVEKTLQHEEALLDLVGVRRVALARLDIHDRQREVAGRDHARIAVLARAAGADEAVLGALVALDLGVLERRPVGLLLTEAPDIPIHDLLDRHPDQLGRARMTCDAHGVSPCCWRESRRRPAVQSTTPELQGASATKREPFHAIWRQNTEILPLRACPMTLLVVFWLILGAWAIAAVLALIKLAIAALAADARGARLAARSLLA